VRVAILGLLLSALALFPSASSAAPRCTVDGTAGADVLRGTLGPDVVCGHGGDDVIRGAAGNDRLLGGAGDDHLGGGNGNDLLFGGLGDDQLRGGPGRDALVGGRGADSCQGAGIGGSTIGCRKAVAGSSGSGMVIDVFPLPCADSCEGGPEEDHEPPAFWSFELGPHAVDVAGGSAELWLAVSGWDSSGIESAVVELEGPSSPWQEVALHEEGSWTFASTIPVPQSTPLGGYRVAAIRLSDAAGNTTVVDGQQLAEEGFSRQFSVYEGLDETAPELTGLSISPTSTATDAAAVPVEIRGDVEDAQSGVRYMEVAIRVPGHEPPYTFTYHFYARLQEGTQNGGTEVARFPLPRFAYPGAYRVVELNLEDWAGNSTEYDEAELEALGFPVQFEAEEPGDTTPPEILDFDFAPTEIPASGGTLVAYMHVRDDLSGLGEFPDEGFSDVSATFWHVPPEAVSDTTGQAPVKVSGTDVDGVWRLEITYPATAPSGEYRLHYLSAIDRASNQRLLQVADIEAAGWTAGFTKLP
jgi:hypothetical protein